MTLDQWSENNLISLTRERDLSLVSNYGRISLSETIHKILNSYRAGFLINNSNPIKIIFVRVNYNLLKL